VSLVFSTLALMRTTVPLALAFICTLFCTVALTQQPLKGKFTDARDGKIYNIVKIGEQIWMAENLNYKISGSKCYNDSIAYCDKYGRLYRWETAVKVCPKGWHLPSETEWDILYSYADSTSGKKNHYKSKIAEKYLKATSGWNDYEGKSGNGEDKFAFSALPGGKGYPRGNFNTAGIRGHWWSSSENDSDFAYFRYMYYYYYEHVLWNISGKDFFFSVRCIQD